MLHTYIHIFKLKDNPYNLIFSLNPKFEFKLKLKFHVCSDLRMQNFSLYLCRTEFESETLSDFEFETEFEIFMNTYPGKIL